jgi:hypothetical protein
MTEKDQVVAALLALGFQKVNEPFHLKGVPVLIYGMSGDGRGTYWWEMGIGAWDITIPGGGWRGGPAYPELWKALP